jgi:alpha-D-xyloside xylohydrolase
MKEFQWCDFEWDDRVFPDVEGMLKRYKEKGLKIDLWINPYIAQGSEFFKEGVKNGYLLKRKDGKGVKQIDWWQAGMALVDFTNPDAAKWYTNKLKVLLEMGVDCFKTDFGERIPIDVEYFDGSDPITMHNYYTFIYNKCVFELLKEVKGEKDAVLFARSATAGCQQFPVHWGGDSSANYPSMAETLRGGLSFAMSGFAFWSHDISGFELTATPDLYKRWAAFGLLSTHSRLHGSTSYRVPWLFDDESTDVVKHFTNLKCILMPYIYQMSLVAHKDGTPVMRPMVFEFPTDMATHYLDMQYMLGDSLLVAPIFNEESKGDYYLPDGMWTNYFTDEVKEGGRWYHDVYDYFSLPLFVRPNTVLAVGADESRPDYDYSDGITYHVYQLSEGTESVCEVPNIEGEIDITLSATLNNGVMTIKLSKLTNNASIVLHHLHQAESVEGADLINNESDLILLPLEEVITIQL